MILRLIISHILLALLIRYNPVFSTIHAYLVWFFGLYLVFKDSNANRIIILIGYVIGSELLWRGFATNVFWEYGKIITLFYLIIILSRIGLNKNNNKIGIMYVLLLLPSFFAIESFNRTDLSHALLGPILMGISLTVFKNIIIDRSLLVKILMFSLMPIISLLVITLISTLIEGNYDYVSAYLHRIETGGIGPNQASNILGLGALFAFLIVHLGQQREKTIFQFLGIILIIQTVLTHSRGGFWNIILSIIIFYFFQITSTKKKFRLIAGTLPIVLTFYYLIFPFLDNISRGSVISRFSNADVSSREEILATELDAFRKNPYFGIGPGQSRKYRLENYGNYRHSHTEYTRLLAEHGMFGVATLFILISLIISIIKNKKGFYRSISLTILSWSLLFMIHSATRLAAPCFLFGFAFSKFSFNQMGEHK